MHPGQPVFGRAFRQKRRSQKPDCFLLSAGRLCLRVVCLEPQLFHSAVCWGVPEQLRLGPPTRRCSPLPASMPTAPGGGRCSLDTARRCRLRVIGPARLRTGNGFWLYGNVPQRGGSLRGVWRNGMVLPAFHARKEPKVATGTLEAPRRNRRDALPLFIICTLMGNEQPYIINMPLFIIDELHLPEKLAGIMMGTPRGLRSPPC